MSTTKFSDIQFPKHQILCKSTINNKASEKSCQNKNLSILHTIVVQNDFHFVLYISFPFKLSVTDFLIVSRLFFAFWHAFFILSITYPDYLCKRHKQWLKDDPKFGKSLHKTEEKIFSSAKNGLTHGNWAILVQDVQK